MSHTQPKAFVSSTFVDLKEHRVHVIEQLHKAGFFVDPMEDWTASKDEPKEFSRKRLDGCDLCIFISKKTWIRIFLLCIMFLSNFIYGQ
jgi:hypothetical protein